MTDTLTGPYLRAWATDAGAGLHRHRAEINRLNVFPIPDSDTGTNMAATMDSAVARLADVPTDAGAAEVATALAAGAVAGARGNSGMVLSQILRAVADTAAMSATGDLSARAVPVMLARAGALVTEALSDPVEGTILTVLRCAATGAGEVTATDAAAPLGTVVTAARDAAVTALERTTGQLDVLGAAGVVDAGGRGLVVILQALVDALQDGAPHTPRQDDAAPDAPTDTATDAASSHGTGTEPHLELVFGFHGDTTALRTTLGDLGDSVVVVGDGAVGARAHVHTVRPGELLERIFALGAVTGLRIEALPEVPAAPRSTPVSPVIALLPDTGDGSGLATLFRGAGAVVCGATDSLATALDALDGPGIVLTNGLDTTGIFAGLDGDREVTVVDTGSFVGGLAALAVHTPGADPEDDAEDMADAVHGQRVADVTETQDGAVTGITGAVDDLLADGGELVTVLYRDDLGAETMDAVTAAVTDAHPDAEIHGVPVTGLPVTAQVGVE